MLPQQLIKMAERVRILFWQWDISFIRAFIFRQQSSLSLSPLPRTGRLRIPQFHYRKPKLPGYKKITLTDPIRAKNWSISPRHLFGQVTYEVVCVAALFTKSNSNILAWFIFFFLRRNLVQDKKLFKTHFGCDSPGLIPSKLHHMALNLLY